ncbi:MFS transporter [Turicimonas muris]|uniref:MFS transporter n=1 Tax=Turicimonas muris TaxID=1796652 RepID=UPI0023F1FB61|nr:MFS transporter [Turicimonas muris]
MTEQLKTRLSCMAFFFIAGGVYSAIMAYMPVIKEHTQATNAQIGTAFFFFGVFSLIALFVSKNILEKIESALVIFFCTLWMSMGICAIAFASSPVQLYMCFGAMGLGVGVFDAAINVQGILFEQRHKQQALNFFHALCSGGGLALSIIAALAASTALKPEVFFPCLAALFVGIGVLSKPGLLADDKKADEEKAGSEAEHKIPLIVIVCGLLTLLADASEGSIAEWGALYLVEEKDAPNALGALVYGVFSAMSFVGRLAADPIREKVGSFVPIGIGLLLGLFGMLTVLFAESAYLCLFGYGVMGIGLAPVVPTLFSLAGSVPGISPQQASSTVAFLAYGGLLFVPPCIGYLAQMSSLHSALFLVVVFLLVVFTASLFLRRLFVKSGGKA